MTEGPNEKNDAPPLEPLFSEPAAVFVSDPSAEAEAVATALRARRFSVADVPLSMLVARVAVQRPRVILVDADAQGAVEVVQTMRELPESGSIHVVFLGRVGGTFASAEDALAHEGSGFFTHPLDVDAVVRKVEALVASQPPPSRPPVSRESQRPSSQAPRKLSQPPPMANAPRAPRDGSLSPELEGLLVDAEAHLGAQAVEAEVAPTPEEELAQVLPEDVLRELDEPIVDDDDGAEVADAPGHPTTAAGHGQETTGARGGKTPGHTTGASRGARTPGPLVGSAPATNAQAGEGTGPERPAPAPEATLQPLFGSGPGGPLTPSWPRAGATADLAPGPFSSTLGSEALEDAMLPARGPSQKAKSVPPPAPPRVAPPSVLGPGDAAIVLARAIGDRTTGTLALDSPDGVRRIVLRDGDIVTAGSEIGEESLLSFLALRGDLSRQVAGQLHDRVPAYGKNAGAALIASGLLTQDQLWPVLRAHAEWLVARAIVVSRGTAAIEAETQGRLRNEPNVFGAAPGAAVFVDVVRRMIGGVEAVAALGGTSAHVSPGAREALLVECGLSPAEVEIVGRAAGRKLGEVVAESAAGDVGPLLYALALLGAIEPIRSVEPAPGPDAGGAGVEALDADAVRARVRARKALVDDGDYFAVLGVARSATGYEVRRAFLELRRAFEPQHLLRPELADLEGDVRTIVTVLDEAYEILRDPARRERYKRAIEAVPT